MHLKFLHDDHPRRPEGDSLSRRAFTLIELLSIIAVLVVVIAMLMPALSKVQRQARTVTCLSNLGQLEQAYAGYLNHNGEHSLVSDGRPEIVWLKALSAVLPDLGVPRFCPEANQPSYGWGSARMAWGPYAAGRSAPWMGFVGSDTASYGFNGWLYLAPGRVLPGQFRHRHDFERTPVFCDANWIDGRPLASDPSPRDWTRGAGPGEPEVGRFFLARHGQSANIAFLDGHAEQIPLQEGRLQQLEWIPPQPRQVPNTE